MDYYNFDNSYAKISEDTVEIFGQVFPLEINRFHFKELDRPKYYNTGELESFNIDPAVINFMGIKIPIGGKIHLYKSGKFHGSCIHLGYNKELTGQREYIYKHKEQIFYICGGIFFYESGNIKSFDIDSPANGPGIKDFMKRWLPMETKFPLEGKKLFLHSYDRIVFYDGSGLPKTVILSNSRNSLCPGYAPPATDSGKNYNVFEISETGKITGTILEPRPNYDYD